MRRSVVGAATYFGSSAIGVGLVLAQTAVSAHYLRPEQFGAISVLVSVQAFLAAVLAMGLDGSLPRLYFDYSEDRDSIALFLHSVFATWALVASAVSIIAVAVLYFAIGRVFLIGADLNHMAPLVAGTSLGLAAVALIQSLQIVEQKPVTYAIVGNAAKLLPLVATFGALILWPEPSAQLVGQFVGVSATIIVATIALRNRICGRPQFHVGWSAITLGVPLLGYSLSSVLYSVADRAILEHYRGLESTGLYSLAQTLALGSGVVLTSLAQVWVPRFLEREVRGPGAVEEFGLVASLFVASGCLIALSISTFADELLLLLGGSAYRGGASILRTFMVGYIGYSLYYMDSTVLLLYKRNWLLAGLIAVGGAVNVVADVILIPRWGGIGSAWASVITLLVLATLTRVHARRLYIGRVNWRKSARMVAVTLGVLIVCWIQQKVLIRSLAFLAASCVIGGESNAVIRRLRSLA